MNAVLYRVGEECSTGQIVAEIFGQSARACVFATQDHQLRWVYWHNRGKLTANQRHAIHEFDLLLARIRSLPKQREDKYTLYALLGKALFKALDTSRLINPSLNFESIEQIVQKEEQTTNRSRDNSSLTDVFVVHGHDDGSKQSVARWISTLGLEPIVLSEKSNRGMAVIEKFEAHSEVGFAVALLTPDDVAKKSSSNYERSRSRQNVIFELGYFCAKLGRGRVALLVKGDLEIPSDLAGVVYIALDDHDGWKLKLAAELKAAGLAIDNGRLT